MKNETLNQIAPLLGALRGYSMLDEVHAAAFHLNGRDFIHFHETSDGVVADVLLAKGRVSMSVWSASEQAELLDRIEARLKSLDSRGDHRRHGTQGGRRRGV